LRSPERPPRGRALRAAVIAVVLAGACRTAGTQEVAPVDLRAQAPEYYRAIERRINGNWRPGGGATRGDDRTGGGIVMISFSIGRNGEIVGTPGVEESSGSQSLDAEAVHAVTTAAPFPPLPAGLGTDRVDLLWRFEHVPARETSG